MSIELLAIGKTETAYDKTVRFIYEEKEYSVLLHWDMHDGYDLQFTELESTRNFIDDPEWAILWEDSDEESLAQKLDNMSDQMLEESYL